MSEFNIFQRMSKIRAEIQCGKNGSNSHNKTSYYLLDDIYKAAKKLFNEHGVYSHFSMEFDKTKGMHKGVTRFVNVDDPKDFFEEILDCNPSKIPGATEAQMVGGLQTYLCKYHLQSALMLDDDRDSDGLTPEQQKKIEKDEKLIGELAGLYTDLELIESVEELSVFWKNNSKFHKTKAFSEKVKEKKEKLGENNESV